MFNFYTNLSESRQILIISLLLTIAAAWPRLYGLGDLSFYMDEETTAFASRSLAEGKMPQMPSGMPYMRSLPHTAMNAISAKVFGLDNEFSYRLPGAIFGILTIPLLFLLLRTHIGISLALLVALLLAFSEWHIITSRQARMYAPFLFFYLGCAFAIFHWARTDKTHYFALSCFLFVMTATFHNLGVLAAFFPLIAIGIKGYSKTKAYKLVSFSVIGGLGAYLYGEIFVRGAYEVWRTTHGIIPVHSSPLSLLDKLYASPSLLYLFVLAGIAAGVWLASRIQFRDNDNGHRIRIFVIYTTSILIGLSIATGHFHGAFLSLLILLLICPYDIRSFIRKSAQPLFAMTILMVIAIAFAVLEKESARSAIKSLFTYPYPYWLELLSISFLMVLLFLLCIGFYLFRKKPQQNSTAIIIISCGLLPLVVVGLARDWAPARYIFQSYPFILVAASLGLNKVVASLFSAFNKAESWQIYVVIYLIGLSGIVTGHGFPYAYRAATLQHGDHLKEQVLVFPVYPDHKTPGEYVRERKHPGDIVIAEDVIQQRWYAGSVDYWLRDHHITSRYLFTSKDGHLHDIYTNSIAMTPDTISYIRSIKDKRIWVITSAEARSRKNQLTKDQENWFQEIERKYESVFTGKDNITKVFCINCKTYK